MIHVTRTIALAESEIHEEFIRASGPGGQNIDKAATAVQLRFEVASSQSLPDEVRKRLFSLARKRITVEGVLVIDARRFRSQKANRLDAMARIVRLIRRAAQKPKIRRKTKPTLASKVLRLEAKRRHAKTKCLRRLIQEVSDE